MPITSTPSATMPATGIVSTTIFFVFVGIVLTGVAFLINKRLNRLNAF